MVASLKSAGAAMLLGSGRATESIAVIKEARQSGFNPKLFAFTAGFTTTLGAATSDVITSVQWTADTSASSRRTRRMSPTAT